jgi:hypothetical protein
MSGERGSEAVPLRIVENSLLRGLFWIGVAGVLVGVGGVGIYGEWDAAGWVAVVVVACAGIPYLYKRFRCRYTVRGTTLVVSTLTGRSEIDLTAVQDIDLRTQHHEFGSKRSEKQLLLIMDDLEVPLGDGMSGLYFEQAGLLALAAGLQQSGLSRTGEVGKSIQRIAERPHRRDFWPPDEPSWLRKM